MAKVAKGKHPHDGMRPIGRAWRVVALPEGQAASSSRSSSPVEAEALAQSHRVRTTLDEEEWDCEADEVPYPADGS